MVVEFGDEPALKPLSLTEVKTSVDLNVDEIEFIRYGCKVGVGRWIWRASIHIRRQQRERGLSAKSFKIVGGGEKVRIGAQTSPKCERQF